MEIDRKNLCRETFNELPEKERLDIIDEMHRHAMWLIQELEKAVKRNNIMTGVAAFFIFSYVLLLVMAHFNDDSACAVSDAYANVYIKSSDEAAFLEPQKTRLAVVDQ